MASEIQPRRSARAASVKPASKAVEKPLPKVAAKAPARGKKTLTKRPSEEDAAAPPPTKRARGAPKVIENGVVHTNGKPKAAPRKRASPVPKGVQTKPYFNPLPTPPEHVRPAPRLFVWGTGNFGQFGMGPDRLAEFEKPQRNMWVEEKIKEGVFGEPEAGLESVAAGGMYTLFIDEKGTVCSVGTSYMNTANMLIRSGHVEQTTMLPSAG